MPKLISLKSGCAKVPKIIKLQIEMFLNQSVLGHISERNTTRNVKPALHRNGIFYPLRDIAIGFDCAGCFKSKWVFS